MVSEMLENSLKLSRREKLDLRRLILAINLVNTKRSAIALVFLSRLADGDSVEDFHPTVNGVGNTLLERVYELLVKEGVEFDKIAVDKDVLLTNRVYGIIKKVLEEVSGKGYRIDDVLPKLALIILVKRSFINKDEGIKALVRNNWISLESDSELIDLETMTERIFKEFSNLLKERQDTHIVKLKK